jgi:preprotein translocase subunit SecA
MKALALSSSAARSAVPVAAGLYPQRSEGMPSRWDDVAGQWIGRLALWSSPLRRVALRVFAARIARWAPGFAALTEDELRAEVNNLRRQLLREGPTSSAAARAFALIGEASCRLLEKRPYAVQYMGGYALLRGGLAEMATGEGKTLTAALPAITAALAGARVHVVTVNEYLASRDAESLRPLYRFFGLCVSCTLSSQSAAARRDVYSSDVAYCVNQELVFDYLRDQLAAPPYESATRRTLRDYIDGGGMAGPGAPVALLQGLCFAIVDEADNIFVDDARTPLIIATQGGAGDHASWRAALTMAHSLETRHYVLHPAERAARLTLAGRRYVDAAARGMTGAWRHAQAREELVQQALAAVHLYARDKHYLIADGKVRIIDESTGRMLEDRSWERGLHQLIEIKEGLVSSSERETAARITYQRFFRRYLHLAAMTGTGAEVASEVRAIFGLTTLRIPTHRRPARQNVGTRVFVTAVRRWHVVVERIRALREAGRPVLIGTRSVAASEHLSAQLAAAGIEHALLNARHDAEEALIIAAAGHPGRVTVATNMAGRGTDIFLHRDVRRAGGLHVILTEFHESRRIDRQLFGRAGRQGDPGSWECLVSLEDEIFTAHVPAAARWAQRRYGAAGELPRWLGQLLRRLAQGTAERLHARMRAHTLSADRRSNEILAFAGRGE